MHLSGILPVSPNIRKKHPELYSLPASVLQSLFLFGAYQVKRWRFKRQINFFCLCVQSEYFWNICWLYCLSSVMASPGEFKGQRKGSCGHIMAVFDLHKKCARCRKKKVGQDPCVLGNECVVCDGFCDAQRERLTAPSYKIRKEKKAGLLVSPKDVTVIGTLDVDDQSSVDSSVQLSAHAPVTSSSAASQPFSFVMTEQFEAMNDKWTEQSAHFEALLSCGNVFSTPKTVVSSLPSTTSALISSKPFINPAVWHTGLVVPVAVQETLPKKGDESKPIKKTQKSSKSDKAKLDLGRQSIASSGPVLDIPSSGDDTQEPVFQPMHGSTTATVGMDFQSTSSEQTTSPEHKTTSSTSLFTQVPKSTQVDILPGFFLTQPLNNRLRLYLVFHLPVHTMVCCTQTTGI